MSAATGVLHTRATRLMDERATVTKLQEDLLGVIESRPPEEKDPTDIERKQLEGYRARAKEIDEELSELGEQIEREQVSASAQKDIRARMAGTSPGVQLDNGEITYQSFATYARDFILARSRGQVFDNIRTQVGKEFVEAARERLARAPEHTLSSDVLGLSPAQHIAQIFQVIDSSRPLVSSAQRVALERGKLTYPSVSGTPTVADQGTEKTVANTPDLNVDMVEANATTYNAGGNLSWQAINWTTPSALELWFRIAAADYALKTEQDAAQTLQQSAFLFNITTTLSALTDFSDVLLALASGAGDVYTNSGRISNTVYMAPDAFYSLAAIAGTEAANFISPGSLSLRAQGGSLAGMDVVVSRGMDSGVIVVGDREGLLVGESPGAPVELRAVEAQIGGLEVGIIGAFEAVVVDPGAFALITTAS